MRPRGHRIGEAELYVDRDEAERVLNEVLNDEPLLADELEVLPIELDA